MKSLQFLMLALMALFLISCGGGNGSDSSENQEETTAPGVTLDSELTPEEREASGITLQTLSTLPIDGSQVRGFSQMFGGNTSADVFSYVDRRVNYLISENTPYTSRIIPGTISRSNALEVFASNPSVLIWYSSVFYEEEDLKYLINGSEIDIDSSHIGVMQVGQGLVTADPMVKAATIVHEARHSDCKDGALASDIENLNRGGPIENEECGHFHGECPPDHIFAGEVACDLNPWGAYIADAIYSDAIVKTCASCTEEQIQAAAINRADAISRPAYDVEALFDGELGPADMSSSNEVR